jgi:hypothetical protein
VSIACVDDDDEVGRLRDPKPDPLDLGSTEGGAGDVLARDEFGVCPIDASNVIGFGGGTDDRGKRTVEAVGDTFDGIGVGRRNPGKGVGLRTALGGGTLGECSALGGMVDNRFDVGGGCGVERVSGGGIVDLRDDVGTTEGGNGVNRLSDGGTVDLRDEAGSALTRALASSSAASNESAFRGSTAGTFVEDRRDEPRDAFCDCGASG